jgi:hypothetical protein
LPAASVGAGCQAIRASGTVYVGCQGRGAHISPKRAQTISLAAAVQIYPNYPMIQNWLSTEPSFPPNQEQNAALGEGAPLGVIPIVRSPALLVLDDDKRQPSTVQE